MKEYHTNDDVTKNAVLRLEAFKNYLWPSLLAIQIQIVKEFMRPNVTMGVHSMSVPYLRISKIQGYPVFTKKEVSKIYACAVALHNVYNYYAFMHLF